MQCVHKERTMWTKADRQLALSLYYKSPSNYKFMLYNLKLQLPGISTIQSWLRILNLKSGANTKFVEKLRGKVLSMKEEQKMCVVLCDEISLKKGLDYNRIQNCLERYEDFDILGRNKKLANHGLVFYLRGLLYNWKIPFYYYISSGTTKGETLAQLMKIGIQKVLSIGLDPRAILSDQGSNNRSAFRILGATKDKPKIYLDNKVIYILFDPLHLLKV